jgi:cytosolic iron-sulfur protein assembly protein CIAO1
VWQPGKDVIASCSYDDSIKMFKEDGTEWVQFANLVSHTSTVWSIGFNGTGDRMVSGSDDLTLKVIYN